MPATFVWNDIGSTTVAQRLQIEKYVGFGVDYINSLLVNPVDFDIELNATVMADDGVIATGGSQLQQVELGSNHYAPVGLVQAATGIEVAGFDSIMSFNETLLPQLFFDPTPWMPADVPSFSIDAISVIVHELLHGLAFNSFKDDFTGAEGDATTAYDRMVVRLGDGGLYFTGRHAIAEYGGPVPLAYGSIAHLGEPFAIGQGLIGSELLYPAAASGLRYHISDLDLAILNDLGAPTVEGLDLVVARGTAVAGTSATDIFAMGAPGGARVDGALGFDIASYGGVRDDYSVIRAGDQIRVGQGGSNDLLTGIERIVFADGALVFDFDSANADAVYRLYGGAFDRTPDEGGLRYWTFNWMNAGGTLDDAAAHFIASAEFEDRYGAWIGDESYVAQLYRNVLDRDGEAAGLTYWASYLARGAGDRADVLVQFTQLEEYSARSEADIANGYWVV